MNNADSATAMLVLGSTRRQQLCARLRAMLKDWAAPWVSAAVVEDAQLTVHRRDERSEKAVAVDNSSLLGCKLSSMDRVECSIEMSSGFLSSALRLPREITTFDASTTRGTIAYGAIEEMLIGLGKNIAASISPANSRSQLDVVPCAVTDSDLDSLDWIATIQLSGAPSAQMVIRLSSDAVSSLLPKFSNAGGLVKRSAVLGTESTKLQAVLGEATITLGDLASLAVDDVLVVESDRSTSCYLANAKGARVANVALGKVGSMRAVQIVSMPTKR